MMLAKKGPDLRNSLFLLDELPASQYRKRDVLSNRQLPPVKRFRRQSQMRNNNNADSADF
jgi:hypothetical protein